MRVKTLSEASVSLEDTVYPDLPCLLVGSNAVHKNNILVYLKKVTTINDKFRTDV